MTPHFANWDERTLDLAIGRFTVGLAERDEAALAGLAKDADLRDFESALAAIHLGCMNEVQGPPAEVVSRLERAGRRHVEASGPRRDATR